MKKLLLIFLPFLITSCNDSKHLSYWCGDHHCISENEKRAYFKKTMTVEVKELKKKKNSTSQVDEIIKQARIDEDKRINDEKDLVRQAKIEEKRRIKEEKDLVRQAKIEEKRRIKEEKDLVRQTKIEEKRRIKEEKDLVRQTKIEKKKRTKEEEELIKEIKIEEDEINKKISKNTDKILIVNDSKIEIIKFNELVEKITKRNLFRPYPDINDIPN